MPSYPKPKIVAEIGCNHKGDFDIAIDLITIAKDAGADYAKFQKRTPKELLSTEAFDAAHPVPYNAYGNSYGEHREFLELSIDQHKALKSHCDAIGIGYATSVWDLTSAKEVIQLRPDFIKVPSACNTHIELLTLLRDDYKGHIHVSLGMTTKEEEAALMTILEKEMQRVVLYSCTSGYPVPFDQVYLLELNRLNKEYGSKLAAVGFSGHHLGIAIDIAAYTLGATWIERHFTKDRTWKGTDHAASLEPGGLQKLVRNLQATHASLATKPTDIVDIEVEQRDKLKYNPKSNE